MKTTKTTRAPAPAPVATAATTQEATAHGPDMLAVIGLHIEASQALQRCASELATPRLSYVEAVRHVDKAAELLHALRNIQISTSAQGATE